MPRSLTINILLLTASMGLIAQTPKSRTVATQVNPESIVIHEPGDGDGIPGSGGGSTGGNHYPGIYKGERLYSLYFTGSLRTNEYLLSHNGKYQLLLQNDGNLCIYRYWDFIWSSGTQGSGAVRLDMQTDGNLCLYRQNGTFVWGSGLGDGPNHGLANVLIMQDDGNLCTYRSGLDDPGYWEGYYGQSPFVWGSGSNQPWPY